MGKYQLLPPLTTAEYESLREDIAVAGVLVPIDVDEHGEILDGHHRRQACDELGIECPTRVVQIPEFAKADYALTVNLARRHLNQAQRRQLVWNSVKDAPGLSDRLHARRCGVSPSTVADVRKDLEAAALVSKSDTRTDKRGRQQPVKKTAAAGTEPGAAADEEQMFPAVNQGGSSAGSGGVATVAGPGHPNTAAGVDTPADGDVRPAAEDSPAAGSGAPTSDGEADRPEPAVTPDNTGHQPPAGDAALDAPVEGPDDVQGDETGPPVPPQEDGSVAGREQQDPAGVSGPAAPGPVELLEELAEKYEQLDVDVLGPLMTSAEMAALGEALDRVVAVVELLTKWNERARS